MSPDPKKVLAANVRRLLGLADDESGVSKLIRLGISNGNAARVLKGETAIGLDVMAEVAKVLKVEPWQLLVADLDPENPPSLHRPEFHWPFRRIDFDAVSTLVGTKAASVEQGLLIALAGAGVPPRKRDGTNG